MRKHLFFLCTLWLTALLPQIIMAQGEGACTIPAQVSTLSVTSTTVCEGTVFEINYEKAPLKINSPYQQEYFQSKALFGPSNTNEITGNLVLADDANGLNSDACDPIQNAAAVSGNIAVIDRGTCTFVSKALKAQDAGAIAVVIVNYIGLPFPNMGDDGNGYLVTIPVIMISGTDGEQIKNALLNGPVNATIPIASVGSDTWQNWDDATQSWVDFFISTNASTSIQYWLAMDPFTTVNGLPGDRFRVKNTTSDCVAYSNEVAVGFLTASPLGQLTASKEVVCSNETFTLHYDVPPTYVTVNGPLSISGSYEGIPAGFGPQITASITSDLVLADDGTLSGSLACGSLINASAINGHIAVIERGGCSFVTKVLAAQNAGATAVFVINNGGPFGTMGDDGSGYLVTIPSLMVSQADGLLIKNAMADGTVNATFPAFANTLTWQYWDPFNSEWVDYAPVVTSDLVIEPGSLYSSFYTSYGVFGYAFRVAGINDLGCVGGSNYVEVGVSRLSVYISGETHFCGTIPNGPVELQALNFGYSDFATILWSPGGETSSSIIINPVDGDKYTVMVMDDFGCTATASKQVLLSPLPVPVIETVTACEGSPVTLRFSGTKAWAGCTDAPNGQYPSYSIDLTDPCAYNYAYGVGGCKTGEYSVINVVEGSLYKFYSELDVGNSFFYEASGDFITITDATSSFVYATGKDYAYYLAGFTGEVRFYTHLSNCANSDANNRVRFTRCFGNPDTEEGMFSWSPGGASTHAITVDPVQGASYSLTFTDNDVFSDVGGCSGTSSKAIELNPLPVASTASASADVVCEGQPFNIIYRISSVAVNSPVGIAGPYNAIPARFGAGLDAALTGNLVLADDGVGVKTDACQPLVNGAAVNGNIAVIDRGGCVFTSKVQAAQDAGAVAVIVVNTVDQPLTMIGEAPALNIPAVMITNTDGQILKNAMSIGAVNVSISPYTVGAYHTWEIWSDFYNRWFDYADATPGSFESYAEFPNTTVIGLPGDRLRVRVNSPAGCVSYSNEIGIGYAPYPTISVKAIPVNNVFTGGDPNHIYLGYGPQSATLQTTTDIAGTYAWTGTNLSCTDCANPVFTPTAAGNYTLTVEITSQNGCSSTASITICVTDIRLPGSKKNEVYICHNSKSGSQPIPLQPADVPAHWKHGDVLGMCGQVCGTAAPLYTGTESGPGMRTSIDITGDKYANGLRVYPNPASQETTVSFYAENSGRYTLRMTDMAGKTLSVNNGEAMSGNNQVKLSTGRIAAGAYLLILRQGDKIYQAKLLKQ